jgi:hypothetical protein
MKRPGRLTLRLVCGAVAVLLLAACDEDSKPPELQWPEKTGGRVLTATEPELPYTVGARSLCIDSAGSVEITGAKMRNPQGGLRLDALAVRLSPRANGNPELEFEQTTIREAGFTSTTKKVKVVCPPYYDAPVYPMWAGLNELGLQVSKPSKATATAEGVDLTYVSLGKTKTLFVPFKVTLCAADDKTTVGCSL